MPTQIKSTSKVLRHENYSTVAAASVATKTPAVPADNILISNTHATNGALVSFDGGNTFITIPAGATLSLDVDKLISYMVKDAVDNSHATLQCLYGSES